MYAIKTSACSRENNVLTTEASDAGLPPGVWPDFIAVLDDAQEGDLFMYSSARRAPDGDLIAAVYLSRASGAQLVIFND